MKVSVKPRFQHFLTLCEIVGRTWIHPYLGPQPASLPRTPTSPLLCPQMLEKGTHSPCIGHIGTL